MIPLRQALEGKFFEHGVDHDVARGLIDEIVDAVSCMPEVEELTAKQIEREEKKQHKLLLKTIDRALEKLEVDPATTRIGKWRDAVHRALRGKQTKSKTPYAKKDLSSVLGGVDFHFTERLELAMGAPFSARIEIELMQALSDDIDRSLWIERNTWNPPEMVH